MSVPAIYRLNPEVKPQCSATSLTAADQESYGSRGDYLADRAARMARKGHDPRRCFHSSSFVIDGDHYCTRHAGTKALAILLEQGHAEQ